MPYEIITGKQLDSSKLCTFGCHVYVQPPATVKNSRYFDLKTKKVKMATHLKHDEGMYDLV
eukprot:7261967-Ditylum_brightwellii.AAC.1